MATRPNPHDAFFRQAFGSPRHIAGLLKLVLPKRLRALLDLDPARIRLHDAAHIDPALRGTASRGGKRAVLADDAASEGGPGTRSGTRGGSRARIADGSAGGKGSRPWHRLGEQGFSGIRQKLTTAPGSDCCGEQ